MGAVQGRQGRLPDPFVIGAVIDLGECLDFTIRENVQLLKEAYPSFSSIQETAGLELPVNKPARNDASSSNVLRYLDFAVITHLLTIAEAEGKRFDTVRGLFGEGDRAYPKAGILAQSHAQIAVRTLDCIKGVFRHPPLSWRFGRSARQLNARSGGAPAQA